MNLDSYNCALCNSGTEENVDHLFRNCQFALNCWSSIGFTLQNNIYIFEAINQIRLQSHPDFYLVVIILMCWAIWLVRNDLIFKGRPPEPTMAKEIFQKEIKILALRVKVKLSVTFDLRVQNLL